MTTSTSGRPATPPSSGAGRPAWSTFSTIRQRLGQHFLVDPAVRDRIIEAAAIEPDDEVLEIGAGPATLTERLAGLSRRLVAVELDDRLAERLEKRFAGRSQVEVVHADILALDLRRLFPQGGEVVVGNIPYYLTGALLPRLLDSEPRPKRLSLLVQKEVAERWTAPTGESVATVAVQTFTEARLALEVPPAAFDPPPRVDSALVVMEVRDRPAVSVSDYPAFFDFVERVFQFRRKQLGGTLSRLSGKAPEAVRAELERMGVDPSRRPQTLTLQEWAQVAGAFQG